MGKVAFRGGTALHKLHLKPAGRYSEDIDLVQLHAGPIGSVMRSLREQIDPWLGKPQWKQSHGRVTLYYRFESEIKPVTPLRLKVEINTREHFSVFGPCRVDFQVDSPWYRGTADIQTYELEELLGTKLRALHQRKKGRDLYDLYEALHRLTDLDTEKVVKCFAGYMENDHRLVTRRQFEQNLAEKMGDNVFLKDIPPLLALGAAFDPQAAHKRVRDELLARLPERTSKRKGRSTGATVSRS